MVTYQLSAQTGISVGSYVTFGTFPQTTAGTDITPIEWLVLDVQDGKALLISRYGLDAQPYNTTSTDVTWETCTLRTWLNSDFLNAAFSQKERNAIAVTEVDNSKKQGKAEDTNGGKNTKDQVFLLSYAEVEQYFDSNEDRMCAPTDYAIKQGAANQGANTKEKYEVDGRATGWWWLRSPGLVL